MRLMEELDFRAALCSFLVLGYVAGILTNTEVTPLRDLVILTITFYFSNKSTLDKL